MPFEGQQLGRYRLLRLLGSGGMGEVYLALDPRIEQQVAIKVIRAEVSPYPESTETKEAARLFEREAKAIAKLDHPNILPLFDYGEVNISGSIVTYIVMPYRREGTLATWLRDSNNTQLLSLQDVTHFINQAADALQHAHDNHIIHQDVKPSNFLIRARRDHPSRPDLFLADFGISKISTATSNMSQSIRGTPIYMAPEQWDGRPVPASDQYSLAIMTYQILTGHPPFQGRLEQVMRQHFNSVPQPPSKLNQILPTSVDAVISRALAKKPEDRFASVIDFSQAFQQAMKYVPDYVAATSLYGPQFPSQLPTQDSSGMGSDLDIRATLSLSKAEAMVGGNHILNLPGGRRVNVFVPADVSDGQVLRLEGQGDPSPDGGPSGALILTFAVNSPADTPTVLPTQSVPASTIPAVRDTRVISRLSSRTKIILLIALAGIIIAGSVGLFYVANNNSSATANSNATATTSATFAVAHAASTSTAFAYFVTSTAEVNASATAEVNSIGTAVVQANATVSGSNDPYPSAGGTLALEDPLKDNTKGYNWSITSNSSGSCQFTQGGYLVNAIAVGYFYFCNAQATNFKNFAYQIQMAIIKGDYGGIIFRDDESQSKRYYFRIGQDGSYALYCYSNNTAVCASSLSSGSNPAIKTGLGQVNLIAVVANGNTITLYVNGQKIDSIHDNTSIQGQIGFAADAINNPSEAVFSDAKVWTF